jgi:CTP synthase (UTP-ammonia lyase)
METRSTRSPVDRGAVVRLPGTVVTPINPHLAAHREAQARIHATAEQASKRRLADAGLSISGRQAELHFADAVEVLGLRFFIGMQGHPELAIRRGRPHPLIAGFLTAVSRHVPAYSVEIPPCPAA